jgi:hypothetical protein
LSLQITELLNAGLSGFGLSGTCLFPDLPMLEGVDMAAPGAIPCPFLGVGIALVNHLNNQMTVQTHRGLTVDILILDSFPHVLDLLIVSG